jgi:hypothetical protein
LRQKLRKKDGRDENPNAGIIDTQSVKGTPEFALESGFGGGKRKFGIGFRTGLG